VIFCLHSPPHRTWDTCLCLHTCTPACYHCTLLGLPHYPAPSPPAPLTCLYTLGPHLPATTHHLPTWVPTTTAPAWVVVFTCLCTACATLHTLTIPTLGYSCLTSSSRITSLPATFLRHPPHSLDPTSWSLTFTAPHCHTLTTHLCTSLAHLPLTPLFSHWVFCTFFTACTPCTLHCKHSQFPHGQDHCLDFLQFSPLHHGCTPGVTAHSV